jgi:hypothetical protein
VACSARRPRARASGRSKGADGVDVDAEALGELRARPVGAGGRDHRCRLERAHRLPLSKPSRKTMRVDPAGSEGRAVEAQQPEGGSGCLHSGCRDAMHTCKIAQRTCRAGRLHRGALRRLGGGVHRLVGSPARAPCAPPATARRGRTGVRAVRSCHIAGPLFCGARRPTHANSSERVHTVAPPSSGAIG